MPSGGARKGAGRKPKPLAEKLAAGNPGHRPLKKVEFTGTGGVDPHEPPAYLRVMEKREQENRPGIPTPTELYTDTVKYLEPSGCLNLVPAALIADYAMAKYYLLHAQYELGKTATVVKIKKGLKKEPAETYEITDFAEAMLKMQKNVLATWEPIWDIVSRNSEQLVTNPKKDLLAVIIGGRRRKSKPRGEPPDGFHADTKSPG
ncbi:hypothetical protein CAFE_01370 [Caprobacter fermentans]|uniref:Terminase n=1 Tax=Caproicibacter fermentans TaxID=2576756 RepID=A0A6N8HUL1_9FIRM|nr:hypothetical protein [Caproicibacter fermentans]MVB09481.1 hypothetical protein [Caproicibacter fermentans]